MMMGRRVGQVAALALLAALTGGRALAAQTIPPCASWVHQPQLDLDIPAAWPVPVGHPLGARAVMRDSVGCPDTTVAIRWFSTDTSLVRPVPTGRNTMTSECKAPGVVTITAVREPFLARARIVCGPWQVERIELVPAGARLGVGDTLRITAIPRTATGQSLPAYWVFWRWDPIDAFT